MHHGVGKPQQQTEQKAQNAVFRRLESKKRVQTECVYVFYMCVHMLRTCNFPIFSPPSVQGTPTEPGSDPLMELAYAAR